MMDMGYQSTKSDPDVWIRSSIKPDCTEYYEYCLIYVDDILCMIHRPEETMNEFSKMYKLKDLLLELYLLFFDIMIHVVYF